MRTTGTRTENSLKSLLELPCRHHIAEIVLGEVFALHDAEQSPMLDVFTKFRDNWSSIDNMNVEPATDQPELAPMLAANRDEIIRFARDQLAKYQPRGDYQELLELILVFMGAPPQNFSFKKPGAVSRPRWMARAIYAIKLWLLWKEYARFQRTEAEQLQCRELMIHLLRVSMFVVSHYQFLWYQCVSAPVAPRIDIGFVNGLKVYDDREVAEVALRAFADHQQYISGVLVALALFDDGVSPDCKRRIATNLYQDAPGDQASAAAIISPRTITIEDMVTGETIKFLKELQLDASVLKKRPRFVGLRPLLQECG